MRVTNPIWDKREAVRYTPANKRTDNCKGCSHVVYTVRDPDTAYERQDMKCKLHGIPVAHGSICKDWVRTS